MSQKTRGGNCRFLRIKRCDDSNINPDYEQISNYGDSLIFGGIKDIFIEKCYDNTDVLWRHHLCPEMSAGTNQKREIAAFSFTMAWTMVAAVDTENKKGISASLKEEFMSHVIDMGWQRGKHKDDSQVSC